MKTKRLIRYRDMCHLIAAARRTHQAGKPVYVAKIMAEYYGPRRKITNQMRKLVAAELDRLNIPRARRVDKPVTFEQVTLNAMTGKTRTDIDRDTLECIQYGPGITSSQNFLEDSIPGVLGGMTAKSLNEMQADLDESYQASLGEALEEINAKARRQDELDLCLSHLADDGNIRAHVLLMHRLGVR